MLGRLLLGFGHVSVVEAVNEKEALEAVRRPARLVIADLETPGWTVRSCACCRRAR
jgi:CheY-like chemotaxis protein